MIYLWFYSDCQHKIEKVIEGYRVALTYNVVLQSPELTSNVRFDEHLNKAVQLYFSSEDTPEKLVFYLNHNYSENSLKWNLLKGTDRTHAFALLAVAKEQDRVPCLALANYRVDCDWFCDDVIDSDTELVFWVDEFNSKFNESAYISDEELCFTTETTDLFEPYKVEEEPPTGNEGGIKQNWYRRACVVLWSSKWELKEGFKNMLLDLNQLTTEKGNEKLVLDQINKAGPKFFNREFWVDPTTIDKLINIAGYVKSKEKAIAILTNLPNQVVNSDRIEYLLFLEENYDREVLVSIIESLNKTKSTGMVIKDSLKVMEKYLKHASKKHHSPFVEILLKRTVKEFLRKNEKYYDLNMFMGTQLNTMYMVFQICTKLEHVVLENKVINYILLHPSVYPLNLANVLLHILTMTPQSEIYKFRNFTISTLKLFYELKSQLAKDETNWSWPFNFPCKCQNCSKLLNFLHSSGKTVYIELSEKNKYHVNSVLKYLKDQPVKCSIEGAKVLMKKEPELVEIRKKLQSYSVITENQLEKWTLTQLKTVQSEFSVANRETTSSSGPSGEQLSSGESINKKKR